MYYPIIVGRSLQCCVRLFRWDVGMDSRRKSTYDEETCCDWQHRRPLWRDFQYHVQLFVVVHKTCWRGGLLTSKKNKKNKQILYVPQMYYEINKNKFAKIKASAFWKNGYVEQRRVPVAVTSMFVFINQYEMHFYLQTHFLKSSHKTS